MKSITKTIEERWEGEVERIRNSSFLQEFLKSCFSLDREFCAANYETMPDGRAIEFAVDEKGELTVLIAVSVGAGPAINRQYGEKFSKPLPDDLLKLLRNQSQENQDGK